MTKKLLSSLAIIICFFTTSAQDNWTVAENTGFTESGNDYIKSLDTFKGYIYTCAGANTYGGLYRSSTGTYGSWSNVIAGNVYSVPALASTTEGGGYIYASTYSFAIDSARILRSFDGVAWAPFYTGYNNIFTHIVPFKGSGSVDSIYVVENTMSGSQILRSAYNSNDPLNAAASWDTVLKLDSISLYMQVNSTLVHSGRFYIGTSTGEIFSTVDGTTWDRNDSVGFGFGDGNNYRITAMEAFGGYVWAGTENYSGAQLWRTSDQLNWTLEKTYSTSQMITDLEATASELWIAADATGTAGGIVERTDGTTYILSSNDGFGQANHGGEAKLKLFGNNMYYGVRNYGSAALAAGPGSVGRGGPMSTGAQIWRTCLVTPPILNLGNDTTICSGSTITLNAGAGGTSYYWNTSETTQTINALATIGTTQTYSCQVTVASGCDASDVILISAFTSPTVTFNNPPFGYPYTLCKGDSIALDLNAFSGLYILDPPFHKVTHDTINGLLGDAFDTLAVSGVTGSCACTSLISVTIDSLKHNYMGDVVIGLYSPSLAYTDLVAYGYGGGSSIGYVGTEFRMDAPSYLGGGSPPYTGLFQPDGIFGNFFGSPNGNWVLKVGDTYASTDDGNLLGWTLKFGYADTIMTYSWTPSGGVSSISILEPVITPPVSATYGLTVTNSIGCSTTASVDLIVPALNTIPGNSAVVCYGGATAIIATGGSTYYWSPSTALNTTLGSTVVTTATSDIVYYVVDTVAGCPIMDSVYVTANPQLFATAGPAQTICFGTDATFSAVASGGTPAYSYTWNDGAVNIPGQTIVVSPIMATAYTLTVTDTNGCAAADYTSLSVIPSTALHGHVSYSGGSVINGNVVAYKYIPTYTYFDTVQVTSLSASGDYFFPSLNAGDYLIKVFADTTAYPALNPTYYGNEWAWDSATVYTQGCSIIDTADIVMIEEIGTGGGPGLLTGTIREGAGFGSALMAFNGFMRTPGDPIPGLDVKLGKNPGGQMVASGSTGPTGVYAFTGVALTSGPDYYTVYVDIPGLGRDSSYSMTVTAGSLNHYYLDYIVDSTTIYIVPNAGVGINGPDATSAIDGFSVYPNPAAGNATIEYEIGTDSNIRLEIFDVLGVKLSELVNADQKAGKYKYNTGNLHLSSGVYFITLRADNKMTTHRLIITE